MWPSYADFLDTTSKKHDPLKAKFLIWTSKLKKNFLLFKRIC